MKFNFIKIFLVLFVLINVQRASAITFGEEIPNGASSFPYIVSIWHSEKASDNPNFICSGELIDNRTVLTAAHCAINSGFYFIKYGVNQLNDESKLHSVSAVWYHPGYSEKQIVNDVGLMLLTYPIDNAGTIKLESNINIKKALDQKNRKLAIYGWGVDQNRNLPTYLKYAMVDDQTSKLTKYSSFRKDVWLPVGKYNSKSKVYAGSCSGDSGGPLVAIYGGKTTLVGVTSWGAEDCELEIPSFYVRLSTYADYIKNTGIPMLHKNEINQNRALPENLSSPTISGSVLPNSIINCESGIWSKNTLRVDVDWYANGQLLVSNQKSILLKEVDKSTTYTCRITASSANGSIYVEKDVMLMSKPGGISQPVISGKPNASQYSSSAIMSCTPGRFENSDEVISSWWVGDKSSSPSEKLQDGLSLTLNASDFIKLAGKFIFCISEASGKGGKATSFDYVQLDAFPKPTVTGPIKISGLPTSGFLVAQNNTLTCSGANASGQIDSSQYAWFIEGNSSSTAGTQLGVGQTINLSSDWFKANSYRTIVCRYSATGPGGTTSIQAFGDVISPNAPVVSSVQVKGLPECYGVTGCDWIGIQVSCEAYSNLPLNLEGNWSYSWRYYGKTVPYYPNENSPYTSIGTGKNLLLTESVLRSAVLNSIGCTATLNMPSGTSTGYSTGKYIDFRNISVADTTPPNFSFNAITPFNGPSIRLRDPITVKFTATDASGISASWPFSYRLILNGTSDAPFTYNGALYKVSGDSSGGTYEQSLILSGSSAGGKLGTYQLYMSATDAKTNSTGWVLMSTFQVTGERTD